MRKLITLLALFIVFNVTAQNNKELIYFSHSPSSISSINIETGELNFETDLEGRISSYEINEKKNVIYVFSLPNTYILDRNTGAIQRIFNMKSATEIDKMFKGLTYEEASKLTVSQLEELKNNEEDNLNLIGDYIALNKDGTGYMYRKEDGRILKYDINKEEVKIVGNTNSIEDLTSYPLGGYPTIDTLHKKLVFSKLNKETLIYTIAEISYVNDKDIKYYEFPLDLSIAKKIKNISNFIPSVSHENKRIDDNIFETHLMLYNSETHNSKSLVYRYNYLFKKAVPIDETWNSIILHNCNKQYYLTKKCPEVLPMPIKEDWGQRPRNKEKRKIWSENTDRINKEYSVKMNVRLESIRNSYYCDYTIFSDKAKTKQIISLEGVHWFVEIYDDKYVFYSNGLEKVMYNLETGEELWTIGL